MSDLEYDKDNTEIKPKISWENNWYLIIINYDILD